MFTYTLPEDNLFVLPAGTTASTALSEGIFVILSLPIGEHSIVISVDSPILRTLDERYTIQVVPRGKL